ncbi:MAG: hypothetical protein R3B54_02825 [Bdellovibrionota bacterium]
MDLEIDIVDRNVPKEQKAWREFLKGNGQKGRYRHFNKDILYDNDARILSGIRTNRNFNNFLTYRNEQRITGFLTDPGIGDYRYAVAGAIMNCPDYEHFYPAALLLAHEQRLGKTLDSLYEDTVKHPKKSER